MFLTSQVYDGHVAGRRGHLEVDLCNLYNMQSYISRFQKPHYFRKQRDPLSAMLKICFLGMEIVLYEFDLQYPGFDSGFDVNCVMFMLVIIS